MERSADAGLADWHPQRTADEASQGQKAPAHRCLGRSSRQGNDDDNDGGAGATSGCLWLHARFGKARGDYRPPCDGERSLDRAMVVKEDRHRARRWRLTSRPGLHPTLGGARHFMAPNPSHALNVRIPQGRRHGRSDACAACAWICPPHSFMPPASPSCHPQPLRVSRAPRGSTECGQPYRMSDMRPASPHERQRSLHQEQPTHCGAAASQPFEHRKTPVGVPGVASKVSTATTARNPISRWRPCLPRHHMEKMRAKKLTAP